MKNLQVIATVRGALILGSLLLVALAPSQGFAQACEIPLFVQQSMQGANVMILADNSGSMNAGVYHTEFDVTVTWSGSFSSTKTYYVKSDGNYTPRDFNSNWSSSPPAPLVSSTYSNSGRYTGNYLNWVYFHASDMQRAFLPQRTRIEVLQSVLVSVIQRSGRFRFGLTVFNGSTGGKILARCGDDAADIVTKINNMEANSWTPLAETSETILNYFKEDGGNAPIEVACQFSFNIVVTDGLPTKDVNVSSYLHDTDGDGNDPGNCTSIGAPYSNSLDCSDYFDDVVYYMAHNDLRPDLEGDQTVVTYVVGFNENGRLLRDAAENGNGIFFDAGSSQQLGESIERAMQDIARQVSSGSAVAVVSTERGSDNRLYRGKFMPLDWEGFMESYDLPYADGDLPLWEASTMLSPSSRGIYTALNNTIYEFKTGNAVNLRTAMGASTDAEAAKLIDWGRGENVAGYRVRNGSLLGTIVHSTPVVVGAPSDYVADESYQNFRLNWENRDKVVYVGANDGMLHAFDAETGEERWAFIPEFALPSYSVMADSFYCHQYTMDQTVTVKDVQLNNIWRTVLIVGGGRGGSSIFALDITDPNAVVFLWQVDLPGGYKSHSEVEIASVGGTYIAVVGSGLDEVNGEAWIYSFDVQDGSLLGSKKMSENFGGRNKTTRPSLIDLNLDGESDLLYVADLLGSVWRFETGTSTDPAMWSMSELYSGTDEITAMPVVAAGPGGDMYVYFGTGAYLDQSDLSTTGTEYFNCVFDDHTGTSYTRSDMKDQTGTIKDTLLSAGWYVKLWNGLGERVTEQAVVVAETVIFSTFAPSLDACVAGGNSYLYQMKYRDGGTTSENGSEDLADRSVSLGEGVASYPVVDLTEGTVVVQSSDATINVVPISSVILRLQVKSWQESYDHVVPVGTPAVVQ